MFNIRPATPYDLEALYAITVKTGHKGSEARHLYTDKKMLGHIYSAPYLKYAPKLVFVVERNDAVMGYCVALWTRSNSKRNWKPIGGRPYAGNIRNPTKKHGHYGPLTNIYLR